MSQIKGTKEACLLNTMHGPRLDLRMGKKYKNRIETNDKI